MQQYSQFVDKFKPRHTSDDTHTPLNLYEAVLSWAERRYGFDRTKVVRPFGPGTFAWMSRTSTPRFTIPSCTARNGVNALAQKLEVPQFSTVLPPLPDNPRGISGTPMVRVPAQTLGVA